MSRRQSVVIGVVVLLTVLAALPATAITFGELDDGAHPNVGALVAEFDGTKNWICSGTLIAEDVFLTAAHCTEGFQQLWVSFASPVDPGDESQLHAGIPVPHLEYGVNGGGADWYDIAVVLLDEPVAGIAPAQLPAEGLLDEMKRDGTLRDATFVTVGYGAVREDKTGGFAPLFYDGQRRFAEQTLLSLQKTVLGLSMQPSTGDGGTCYGDSGGPHFLGDVLVSLTVTGDAPCRASDKTYRVDSASARAFLADFVDLP